MFDDSLLNKMVEKWKVMREAKRKGKKEGGMGTNGRSCQDGRVTERKEDNDKIVVVFFVLFSF